MTKKPFSVKTIHTNRIEIKSLSHIINFGKYKGQTVESVMIGDANYCEWMFSQPNIKVDVKIREDLQMHLNYSR